MECLNQQDCCNIGDFLVNVLDYVLLLDERYGEDWTIKDLTEGERIIYDHLRTGWNQTFGNCGPVEFHEIEEND